MLSCKESTRLMSEAQDRDLSFAEKASLWMHLLVCNPCGQYREQMDFLRQVCRRHPDRRVSEEEKAS